LLPQRLQHRSQRGRAPGGQIPLGAAGAAEGDPEPQPPVLETVVPLPWAIASRPAASRPVASRPAVTAAAFVHLLGQARQTGQAPPPPPGPRPHLPRLP